MKILLATYWLLPHVGGVWAYVQELKTSLEQLGHEVDVFARHPDEKSYYIINTGQRVEKDLFKRIVQDQIRAIYASHRVFIDDWIVEQEIELCCFALAASYFKLNKYDVIHTQDVISSRALWQIKPKHLPLISTIHGCLAADYWISTKGRAPSAPIWKYACAREYYGATSSDVTIVPTHWLRNTLAGYLVPSDHMQVIPYGMNIEKFIQRMNEPPEITVPSQLNFIVCPARLDKVKGHSCLLDALYKLKQVRSDWVCLFIGDGELRNELEQKSNRLGLTSHVIFMGSRRDVPALLKQADIVVLPSLNDNQPYAVMEAQIACKPIVVSDAGGIPEMVQHEYTGLMSKAGNSDELSHCLNVLLHDRVLREQLATNGHAWGITQWSLMTMMQRTMQVYESVLNKNIVHKVNHPPKQDRNIYPWLRFVLRGTLNLEVPSTFYFVDDHIIGSILYQATQG